MIVRPTSVDPVKQTLRTASWVTKRCPTTLPFPGRICSTPSGNPASSASSPMRSALSGVSSAGLSTTVLPAARAGAKPQPAMAIGKFHGHDDPHHAERLVEGQVDATGDGDLAPGLALGRGRVVLEHVADVARLPAGVADDMAGVGHLELGQLLAVGVHRGGEAAEQAGPVPRRHVAPALEGAGPPGRWPGRPRPRSSDGTVVMTSPVAGLRTVVVDILP